MHCQCSFLCAGLSRRRCLQFGKRCVGDQEEVAVKFFLNRAAFRRELRLYRTPALEDVMLPLVDVSDASGDDNVTLAGVRLPPFIVVERGEVRPTLLCDGRSRPHCFSDHVVDV